MPQLWAGQLAPPWQQKTAKVSLPLVFLSLGTGGQEGFRRAGLQVDDSVSPTFSIFAGSLGIPSETCPHTAQTDTFGIEEHSDALDLKTRTINADAPIGVVTWSDKKCAIAELLDSLLHFSIASSGSIKHVTLNPTEENYLAAK